MVKFLRGLVVVFGEFILLVMLVTLLLFPQSARELASMVESYNVVTRVLLVTLLTVFIVIGMVVQLNRQPRQTKGGVIVNMGDRNTLLDNESVRRGILKVVSQIDQVESAEVEARSANGRAAIVVNAKLNMSGEKINLPKKQREIDRAIKQVVIKQLGVRLAHAPSINVSFIEMATPAKVETPSTVQPRIEKPVSGANPSSTLATLVPAQPVEDAVVQPVEAEKPTEDQA
ncbi:MAG: hypothetical protein ACOYLB_13195 [Phototrophicaceae bacterium]